MRTVIIGAGNAGKNLVAKLCEMGHDVVVIDNDAVVLDELAQNYDVMTLVGHGSDPTILENDVIGRIDLLAAVTASDEINFLACCWAKAAGAGHTIARLSSARFLHSSLVNTDKLGVDRPMVHKGECAKEVFDVLYMPGTLEVTSLLDGKIAAIGLKLPDKTPLAGKSLKEFKDDKWFGKVRFIGMVKQGKLIIPDGDSRPEPGDDVYIVLPAGQTDRFLDWIRGGGERDSRKSSSRGEENWGCNWPGCLRKRRWKR